MKQLRSLALICQNHSEQLAVLIVVIVLSVYAGATPTLRSLGIPTALPARATQLSAPSLAEAPWLKLAGKSSSLLGNEVEVPKVEEFVVEDLPLNISQRNRASRRFRLLMFHPAKYVTGAKKKTQ